MFLSIIIPAYNEENVIKEAINRTIKYFNTQEFEFETIVVDDGSCDRTAVIVHNEQKRYQNLVLLRNEINRGKGYSVRRGVLQSRGEWILFFDADLSVEPQEFEKFRLAMSDYDIIIGSRTLPRSQIVRRQPLWRDYGGKIFNVLARIYLGFPFYDTQCGFKCFSKKTKIIFEKQRIKGWIFDMEILYLARKLEFRVKEVSITWSHQLGSKVKLRQIFGALRDFTKIKFYSL